MKRVVPLHHLTVNLGGEFWNRVKANPDITPPFEALSKATLWVDTHQYQKSVWSWLCGEGPGFNVDVAKALSAKEGDPVSVDIEVGERKARLNVGDVGPLLRKRSLVDLLYIEVDSATERLPP